MSGFERRALELDQLEADAHAASLRVPLKFENTAKIGDVIKAFDHQPREGVDCWVIGEVIAKGIVQPEGYRAYTILVTECSHGQREGADIFVPFQISPLDYPERVTLLVTAAVMANDRSADRVDGYDRDDTGESPDF